MTIRDLVRPTAVAVAVWLLVLAVTATLSLAGCRRSTPAPTERDPGTVIRVDERDGDVFITVRRSSDGTTYVAGPFGGTACRRNDVWPVCQ